MRPRRNAASAFGGGRFRPQSGALACRALYRMMPAIAPFAQSFSNHRSGGRKMAGTNLAPDERGLILAQTDTDFDDSHGKTLDPV